MYYFCEFANKSNIQEACCLKIFIGRMLTEVIKETSCSNIFFNVACRQLRACLHGGGGPQVGEVTRLGGVTRLSI